ESLTFGQIVSDFADYSHNGATDDVTDIEQEVLRERQGDIMDQATENIAYVFVDRRVDGISDESSVEDIIQEYKEEYDLTTVRDDTRRELSQQYRDKATLAGVLDRAKSQDDWSDDLDMPLLDPKVSAEIEGQQR